jgi:hypothetical protein
MTIPEKELCEQNNTPCIQNQWRFSFRFIVPAMIICLLLITSVLLGQCLTDHSHHDIQDDESRFNNIKKVMNTRPFETSEELLNDIDKVINGTSNKTTYGDINYWDVSCITNFSSLFSSHLNTDVVTFNKDSS